MGKISEEVRKALEKAVETMSYSELLELQEKLEKTKARAPQKEDISAKVYDEFLLKRKDQAIEDIQESYYNLFRALEMIGIDLCYISVSIPNVDEAIHLGMKDDSEDYYEEEEILSYMSEHSEPITERLSKLTAYRDFMHRERKEKEKCEQPSS